MSSFCMDRRTSELLYRIYQGEIEVLPEKLAFYRVRLLDFNCKGSCGTEDAVSGGFRFNEYNGGHLYG